LAHVGVLESDRSIPLGRDDPTYSVKGKTSYVLSGVNGILELRFKTGQEVRVGAPASRVRTKVVRRYPRRCRLYGTDETPEQSQFASPPSSPGSEEDRSSQSTGWRSRRAGRAAAQYAFFSADESRSHAGVARLPRDVAIHRRTGNDEDALF